MTAVADRPAFTTGPPPAPRPAVVPPVPVATLTADLMPAEIRLKRRLAYLKRRLVFVLAALVALVVLGDLLVRQQTVGAQNRLAATGNQIATLNQQLRRFGPMLATQSETREIRTQLDGVMGEDVSWPALLEQLAAPAPAGLRLTSIGAQVSAPGAAADAGTGTTSPVAAGTVGSLTLAGTAPSWRAVATYVRGLSAVAGFTGVNPSSVSNGAGPSGGGSELTFTIDVGLTDAALSGRYSTTGATAAGAGQAGSAAVSAIGAASGGSSGGAAHGATSHTGTSHAGTSHAGTSHAGTTHTIGTQGGAVHRTGAQNTLSQHLSAGTPAGTGTQNTQEAN